MSEWIGDLTSPRPALAFCYWDGNVRGIWRVPQRDELRAETVVGGAQDLPAESHSLEFGSLIRMWGELKLNLSLCRIVPQFAGRPT
jgi:hypothetical protein